MKFLKIISVYVASFYVAGFGLVGLIKAFDLSEDIIIPVFLIFYALLGLGIIYYYRMPLKKSIHSWILRPSKTVLRKVIDSLNNYSLKKRDEELLRSKALFDQGLLTKEELESRIHQIKNKHCRK